MSNRNDKAGRLLALALRHDPSALGLALDAQGYADVEEVLQGLARRGKAISREDLEHIVATNDKKRFAFSADGRKIRASQGHSVQVELGYAPATPPPVLYHGTATHHVESIQKLGIMRGQRHHVHLSAAEETALKVGKRHGDPVLLEIDAARMQADGHAFYVSDNGVWLVEHVPVTYLKISSL
jgi:putative RNA 2'-phosphotransferase